MSVALAPRARYGGERLVAGGARKEIIRASVWMVRPDVLRDAALARRHLGAADVVQQRGPFVGRRGHDGDHRRAAQGLDLSGRAEVVLGEGFGSSSAAVTALWPISSTNDHGRVLSSGWLR